MADTLRRTAILIESLTLRNFEIVDCTVTRALFAEIIFNFRTTYEAGVGFSRRGEKKCLLLENVMLQLTSVAHRKNRNNLFNSHEK